MNEEIESPAEQNNESRRRVCARSGKGDLMDSLAAEMIACMALDLIHDNCEYEDVPRGKEDESPASSTGEAQAVPGEMQDPTEAPPEAPAETAPETPKS